MLYQNLHIHMVLVVVMIINCPFITCFWTALFWKYFVSCWCLHNSSKELELCNNISKKKRLAKCLEIKCIATGGCNFIYSTYTSTRVSKTNQAGQNPFDINARSIISCCEIYHCCEKLHHWRKEINFVQKLNCRGVSTKAILLMAPPHTNISQGYIQRSISMHGW